jgi:tRNA pseudouridine55 synthase
VIVPHAPTSGRVQLVEQSTDSSKQMFIGVGEILDDGRVAPRRLVVSH